MIVYVDPVTREPAARGRTQLGRDPVNFTDPTSCATCGRQWGNHLTEFALAQNPRACHFAKKS